MYGPCLDSDLNKPMYDTIEEIFNPDWVHGDIVIYF